MRFPTAVVGTFAGYKKPFEFTSQTGEDVNAPAKLQFLVTEDGRAELLDVREKDWTAAGGPRVTDLPEGSSWRLNGHAVVGANYGRFALDSIEQL